MKSLLIRLPPLQAQPEGRPRFCPRCGSPFLQAWGRTRKPIRDLRTREVLVGRYRCPACRHCFRHYPEGDGQAGPEPAHGRPLCPPVGPGPLHPRLSSSRGWQ
jgi:hypothetical protein